MELQRGKSQALSNLILHIFVEYFHVPGTLPGAKDTTKNKERGSCCHEAYIFRDGKHAMKGKNILKISLESAMKKIKWGNKT